jgi:hypothetical protein
LLLVAARRVHKSPETLGGISVAVSRKFVDSDGVNWQVYELTPGDGSDRGDGGRSSSDGQLYFFSRGVTRALAPYPDDWSQMDWPGLERLCRRASPPARPDSFRIPQPAAVHGG